MNFLSIFVLIPLLMLAGLWAAQGIKAIRGVMVTGASALLIASIVLTFMYLGERSAGNTAEMLFRADTLWYAPLHISYSVGVTVCYYRIHRDIRLMASATFDQRIFPLVHPALYGSVRILYIHRLVHHVHVLRNRTDSDVLADWCMGFGTQRIRSHETDTHANGWFRLPADRYSRNLFRLGSNDDEPSRNRTVA